MANKKIKSVPAKKTGKKTGKKKAIIITSGKKAKKVVITPTPVAEIAVHVPDAPIEISVHDPNVFERALAWVDDKMKKLDR